MKTSFLDSRFGDQPVRVVFGLYKDMSPAISLVSECGEPWATCSVCIPENPAPDGCVYIKTFAENEGMSQILIDNGIIENKSVKEVKTDYVTFPAYKLSAEALDMIQDLQSQAEHRDTSRRSCKA